MGSLSAGGPDVGGDPTRSGDGATEHDAPRTTDDEGGISGTAGATGPTPPGWYDDRRGSIRWWDGAAWSEHVVARDASRAGVQTAVVSTTSRPVEPAATPATSPYVLALATPRSKAASPGGVPYTRGLPRTHDTGAYVTNYPRSELVSAGSATKTRRSRTWVVSVVLGVLVLGAAIGSERISSLTMAEPVVITDSRVPAEVAPEQEPAPDAPSTADRQATIDAVKAYAAAVKTNDCSAYFGLTTEHFRSSVGLVDCEAFAQVSAARTARVANDSYHVAMMSIFEEDGRIFISTTESFRSWTNEAGDETGNPDGYRSHYQYALVRSDVGWVIDEVRVDDQ